MSQIFFHNVFEALSEVAEDYQFMISQYQTVTHNARAGARWDIINTNLIKKLENINIEAAIIKRGFWEMALLLSSEDNCIYTLMRKNRFEGIISNPAKNAPKYVQALATLNSDLGLANPELFEFQKDKSKLFRLSKVKEGFYEFDKEQKKQARAVYVCKSLTCLGRLDNLCKSLNSYSIDQKPHYKIITFDTDFEFRIINFQLNILDYTCHKHREENIMNFIKPIYSNEIQQVDNNTEQMPQLKLTNKAKRRIADLNSVELKDTQQLNSKEV